MRSGARSGRPGPAPGRSSSSAPLSAASPPPASSGLDERRRERSDARAFLRGGLRRGRIVGSSEKKEVRVSPIAAALLVTIQSAPSASPPPVSPSRPEIASEVERGRRAYNAQDLAYYDATLGPDVVYIADDGAVFSGKERVMQLFTRIFGRAQKQQLEIGAVTTGGKGDVA